MQSGCLYSSLFFEHYNRILLCQWVLKHYGVCLIDAVSCHNAFTVYLDLTSLRIGALLRSSVCNKCYMLANNSVKNVSVTCGSAFNAVVESVWTRAYASSNAL